MRKYNLQQLIRMNNDNKWEALSMRDRAFLIRQAVKNGITDINSVRDLYNQTGERIRLGPPYRTFESGSDYDYFNAAPENMPQENDGHWDSRNPHTGQLLKSPNHPTYNLLLEGENQAGYKIQKIGDREYSFPNGHRFGGDESNNPGFFKSLVNLFKPKPKPKPAHTLEWPTSYEELDDKVKKIVQDVATKYNYAYDDIADLYNSGKMNAPLSAVYQYAPSGRVRDNDVAATKEASEDLEKKMNIYMYNSYPKSHGQASPNMTYAIPYIESEEIRVPGVGRTTKNALDSLAKYAAKVKIPLYEAVGLAAQETALGAIPVYNYKAIPKNATEEEKQKVRDYNRALGNSSYFRNYGVIPAEHLVRDFRYNYYPIDRSIPPLEHAFTYWKEGNYNRGDKNHTRDVRAKGKKVMSSDIMKEWAKHSKYAQQALKNNLD